MRIYFLFDRKLLTKLSRCAWKVLYLFLTEAVAHHDAKPGAAIAAQSFGDFQNYIQDEPLVKKILKHLHLWDVKRKPAPRANSPPAGAHIIYDPSSAPGADDYIIDADYPIEAYL